MYARITCILEKRERLPVLVAKRAFSIASHRMAWLGVKRLLVYRANECLCLITHFAVFTVYSSSSIRRTKSEACLLGTISALG